MATSKPKAKRPAVKAKATKPKAAARARKPAPKRPTKAAPAASAASGATTDIESVLNERRIFAPPASFAAKAHVPSIAKHKALSKRAVENPEAFWGEMAKNVDWIKPWKKVLDWKPPFARWFDGGLLNLSANCVDRHAATWRKNKAAIVWEGEPGDERVLTYGDLLREVSRFANVLKSLGVEKGDRVAIYMPMIPELPIALLACTRIGATHSVIFGGFSAESIKDRVLDCGASIVITADGGYRRGAAVSYTHLTLPTNREV